MPIIIHNNPNQTVKDTPLSQSALGTPVYGNLHIKGGSYKTNEGILINYDELVVDTVLFNVNQSKNIVKTAIQGSDKGTVKEYIGMGDYVIGCSIIFSSGQVDVHPWIFEQRMTEIFKSPEPLTIFNQWLNDMEIYQIVITDFTRPQLPGEYSQANISFNALSDTPIILAYTPPQP